MSKRKSNKIGLDEKEIYDSINIDRLIELVSPCPYLFNGKDPQQANRSLKKKKWDEFDKILNVPDSMSGMTQKRFKNLKDFFYRKKKALQEAKASGSASIDMSKFQIRKKIRFLDGTNVVRLGTGNMGTGSDESASDLLNSIVNHDNSENIDSTVCVRTEGSSPPFPTDGMFSSGSITDNTYLNEVAHLHGDDDEGNEALPAQKKKKKNQSRTESMFELAERIEKMKSDNIKKALQTSADDDRSFLLSLLSNMKKLDSVDNSEFRIRIQMLLHKLMISSAKKQEQFENSNPQHQYCKPNSFRNMPTSPNSVLGIENGSIDFDNDSLDDVNLEFK